jgi:hypothetical protein
MLDASLLSLGNKILIIPAEHSVVATFSYRANACGWADWTVPGAGKLTGADFADAEETITRLVIASLMPAMR